MKTAEEWLNAVGEAAELDMFCGDPHKPGSRTEEIIKSIQADAFRAGRIDGMMEAAEQCLVREEIGHGFKPRKRISSEIHAAILKDAAVLKARAAT